jgi:uncharacterized membrane protein SpoIIM required for sporulation
MWCARCGAQNPPVARFCTTCGLPLGKVTLGIAFSKLAGYSYRLWRENPGIILPTLLVSASSLTSQVLVMMVLVGLVSYLSLTGALGEIFQSVIDVLRLSALGFGFENQSMDFLAGWFYSLLPILIGTLAAWIIVQTLLGGLATSIEYSAYSKVLRARTLRIRDFLEEGFNNWRRMTRTYLAVNLIVWTPLFVAYALLVYALFVLFSGLQEFDFFTRSFESLGRSLQLLGLASIFGLFGLLLNGLTTFAYAAVAFEGKSVLGAISSSFGTVGRRFGAWILYGILRIGLALLIALVASFLQFFGIIISALASTLILMSITPILHLLKTAIHASTVDNALASDLTWRSSEPEKVPTLNVYITGKVFPAFRRAFSAAVRYAVGPSNYIYHAGALFVFVIAYTFGEYVSAQGIVQVLQDAGFGSGGVNPAFTQLQPPFLSLELFFHNWLVSINMALAGAVFGLPTIATLFFNGWLVGVLRPLIPDLDMFLAAILPHGIIEIPAFLISGSAGIRFGYRIFLASRSEPSERFGIMRNALRETTYIVLGLAPLYLVAGVIEGTITPVIMRMAGWF